MSSFDFMPWLTNLNLSKTRIEASPESNCNLTSLEVLIIQDCVLLALLPSEEGSLRRLEVLHLQGTELNKLADEISELGSLRQCHLKVSFYGTDNRRE